MVELPVNIQNFIAQNFPNHEIDESALEIDCTGSEVYEVELEGNDDKEVELTFDLEGNLLFTETEIQIEDLPQSVLTTIETDYAGFELEEAEHLELATDGVDYEVELEQGDSEIEVRLTSDGSIICEQEEEED